MYDRQCTWWVSYSVVRFHVTHSVSQSISRQFLSFFFFFQAEDGIRDYKVTGVQTCVFFFQAEDGIRDYKVTGVQTCALPISGVAFDQILAAAYPDGRLATLHGAGRAGCERLGAVERWLAERSGGWRPRLHAEGGFEPPRRPVTACRLAHGRPFADAENNRIHVRGIATGDDRITVVHEYLHLAFRFHPRGLDEDFVERLARELAREP